MHPASGMNPVLEWARRHQREAPDENLIDDLRAGMSVDQAAERQGMPRAAVHGVQSYYEYLRHPAPLRVCAGTACRFAGGWMTSAALPGTAEVRCLGRCYEGRPCRTDQTPAPIPRRALVDEPVVLRHVLGAGGADPERLYRSVARPAAEEILATLAASGLRGRGGAAFPTAAKWEAARRVDAPVKYVVANGDEGDPGSYVDRLLLEEDPHAVLAGMCACARAIDSSGASGQNVVRGVVYVRAEYPAAAARACRAIAEATEAGLLPPGFAIEVHVGAGSYVCGEETALLRGIEGLRGEAQPRPPYPTECGLHGWPTVVQNVETLAIVPWLLESGRKPASKAFCLSGAVASPAVVEAGFGISLAELLARGGGGAAPRMPCPPWKMALIGGPMGRVLPVAAFDTPLGYDTLPGLGHGGVVVFDAAVSARDLAGHLFEFAASESCGACTPCRVGTAQLGHRPDRAALERLLDTLELGSMCGFGQGVPRPIRDLLQHFPDEMFPARGAR
jgi:NADH:ubiquinone oxidoreductase subunit F (NADH-binding)